MILKEEILNDSNLQKDTYMAYHLMQAALTDTFAEMLEIDKTDEDIFVEITLDVINYLKTVVSEKIHEKTVVDIDKL